jgi:hypothetical protein
MLSTFSTCWYPLNSKFSTDTYLGWMKHMLQEVNNYYLVVFTDEKGEKILKEHCSSYFSNNPNIKIVKKPYEKWYNYKYQENWITNHSKNTLLNNRTEWKLNMLWCEKQHFVNDARLNSYFPPTEFYGWCDIGYFREGPCPTFASPLKIQSLNKNKIYYACVDEKQLHQLHPYVQAKNKYGLPVIPIPANQNTVAGGFYIAHHDKIENWATIFDTKLALYFKHDYLVKDDQMIIVDCILSDPVQFKLIQDPNSKENPWFYFRRFLSI